MADGLIRAALDRYKQPKYPPVLQSAAPCVAYIYSPVCSVRAHNSFSICNSKHFRLVAKDLGFKYQYVLKLKARAKIRVLISECFRDRMVERFDLLEELFFGNGIDLGTLMLLM